MSRSGVNFTADLPVAILKNGKTVEYYLVLKTPSLKADLTYPAAPLSFTVGEKAQPPDKKDTKNDDTNKSEEKDKDKKGDG